MRNSLVHRLDSAVANGKQGGAGREYWGVAFELIRRGWEPEAAKRYAERRVRKYVRTVIGHERRRGLYKPVKY
jgi:hypothetical protein